MRERTGKKKSRLETWLKSAMTPVFLLSPNRRVLFFNRGCEHLTGWSADDVVGEIAEFASDSEPQSLRSLVNSLCPPPTVFAGQEQDVPTFLHHRTGSSIAKLIRFIPVHEEADRITSVLGLISPLPAVSQSQPMSLALQFHAELSALRWSLRQRFGVKTVVARSSAMQRVLQQIGVARLSSVPVHFVGPDGVGKEHLARAVHHEGETQHGLFVPINCDHSPFEVVQTLKRLLHPQADDAPAGGLQPRTLFLIDVGNLPRDGQERLLEAYASATSSTRHPTLPRLMSSSSESLRDAVEDERLMPELFYLLTTLVIEVPPLRLRSDDLPPLAQAFLEMLNRGSARQVSGFADAVWPQLREYNWPGNLDELALVVQESREHGTSSVIEVKDLPLRFRAGLDAQAIGPLQPLPGELPIPALAEHMAQVERELIERALAKAKQNKTLAAKLLQMPRPVLYRRLQALGMINEEADKTSPPRLPKSVD